MKASSFIALFLGVSVELACAETFIGPTTATNRLLVASNSAIIITTTLGDFTNSTQVVLDGGTAFPLNYFAPLQNGTVYALGGPAELIFSNAVLFTFFRLTNSAIYSQGIANDPIGVSIASNKTMHVFGVHAEVSATFSRPSSAGGGSLSFALEPNAPAEFTGPGTLYLNSGLPPPYIKFISYFLEEDGFTLPDLRTISGPSGSFAISVEKSVDMQSWSPVLLQNTSGATQAFYRLRIQH
jgi:hypothetical protein